MKVAALVVTYNRKELLAECLDALLAQTLPVDIVAVVDNASTDGTGELFSNGKFSTQRIIYHNTGANLGGAGGFKEGLALTSKLGCDWVWLMDDDCIPEPRALQAFASHLEDLDTAPSFLASSVFGPDGEPMNVPTVSARKHSNGYGDWYRHLAKGMVEIEMATFVSLLINADAVKTVGLPIGSYFIWGDDSEYTSRLTRYYAPAYLCGDSVVIHKRSNAKALNIKSETSENRIKNYRFHTRNNLINTRYYKGRIRAFRAILSNSKTCISCLFLGDGGTRKRLARSKAIALGIFDYVFGRYELEDLGVLLKNRDS